MSYTPNGLDAVIVVGLALFGFFYGRAVWKSGKDDQEPRGASQELHSITIGHDAWIRAVADSQMKLDVRAENTELWQIGDMVLVQLGMETRAWRIANMADAYSRSSVRPVMLEMPFKRSKK
jgi:hypothetical protein